MPLKIKRVDAYPLEIPLKQAFITSKAKQTQGRFVFVEIESGDGIVGLGEADPRPHLTGETLQSAVHAIKRYLAPAVLGLNAGDFESIRMAMDQSIELNPAAKSAIDIAVHDLASKTMGIPMYHLLGGETKRELRINAWCGIHKPDEAVDILKGKLAQGFDRAAKVKVGLDVSSDCELVKRVREILPVSMDLIIDANQAWTLPQALDFLKRFDDGTVTVAEQPLHWKDVAGMAELTRHLSMSIMADESVWSPHDASHLLNMRAARMLNIKLLKSGGLYVAKKIASLAEVAGVKCMIGSTVETSISAAAEAHFAMAVTNVEYIDPTIPRENLVEDIAEGLRFEGGRAILSREPGLGVKVKEDIVQKYLARSVD